jgi:hypothetical protein
MAASALQIMVGAVSRVLKVERCERVQLVAAAVRLYIASCHDCVFYLGVNRAPLLLGDNRFLQVRSLGSRPAMHYALLGSVLWFGSATKSRMQHAKARRVLLAALKMN